jgi:hypothetical protein
LPQRNGWHLIAHGYEEKAYIPLNETGKAVRNTYNANGVLQLIKWVTSSSLKEAAVILM